MAPTEKPAKRPVGRPSKYDPSFCERVIELGRLGKSRAYIASEINVSRETLDEWERDYPEFSDAMDEAMRHSQRWWEQAGQDGLTAGPGSFNAAVWSRSMAARFPLNGGRNAFASKSPMLSTTQRSSRPRPECLPPSPAVSWTRKAERYCQNCLPILARRWSVSKSRSGFWLEEN